MSFYFLWILWVLAEVSSDFNVWSKLNFPNSYPFQFQPKETQIITQPILIHVSKQNIREESTC